MLLRFACCWLLVQPLANCRRTTRHQRFSTRLSIKLRASSLRKVNVFPALSIGIYDRGKTVFHNYGTTSKSKVCLPDRTSIYEIASITKTFTGALASGAVVDGKMTLDGDFRAYLKEPYPNLEKNGKFITLRLLAAHRQVSRKMFRTLMRSLRIQTSILYRFS